MTVDLVLILLNLKDRSIEYCCRKSFQLSLVPSRPPGLELKKKNGRVFSGMRSLVEFSILRKCSKDYKTVIYEI